VHATHANVSSSSGGAVLCDAPRLDVAGALDIVPALAVNLTFEPEEQSLHLPPSAPTTPKLQTYGDAVVAAGVLLLTGDAPGQRGSCILAPSGCDVEPSAMSSFIATFDLRISGVCGGHVGSEADGDGAGCGGVGISFVWGNLPTSGAVGEDISFGEEGAGSGLRIQLLTWPSRTLVALYGRRRIATVPLDETLRAHGYQQVEVRYLDSGLSVRYGARMLLSNVLIEEWAPHRSWRFGFGARTSGEGDDETSIIQDSHTVDNVVIHLGTLGTRRGVVPVEVGLNGGQFSRDGLLFTYLPAVRALSMDPVSGPRMGGTFVAVLGEHTLGGMDYQCSFNGSVVAASVRAGVRRPDVPLQRPSTLVWLLRSPCAHPTDLPLLSARCTQIPMVRSYATHLRSRITPTHSLRRPCMLLSHTMGMTGAVKSSRSSSMIYPWSATPSHSLVLRAEGPFSLCTAADSARGHVPAAVLVWLARWPAVCRAQAACCATRPGLRSCTRCRWRCR
jgi:hypothetical protein